MLWARASHSLPGARDRLRFVLWPGTRVGGKTENYNETRSAGEGRRECTSTETVGRERRPENSENNVDVQTPRGGGVNAFSKTTTAAGVL